MVVPVAALLPYIVPGGKLRTLSEDLVAVHILQDRDLAHSLHMWAEGTRRLVDTEESGESDTELLASKLLLLGEDQKIAIVSSTDVAAIHSRAERWSLEPY